MVASGADPGRILALTISANDANGGDEEEVVGPIEEAADGHTMASYEPATPIPGDAEGGVGLGATAGERKELVKVEMAVLHDAVDDTEASTAQAESKQSEGGKAPAGDSTSLSDTLTSLQCVSAEALSAFRTQEDIAEWCDVSRSTAPPCQWVGMRDVLMRIADCITEVTPGGDVLAGLQVKKDTIITITQGATSSDHRVVCSIFIAHTTTNVRLHLRLNRAAQCMSLCLKADQRTLLRCSCRDRDPWRSCLDSRQGACHSTSGS